MKWLWNFTFLIQTPGVDLGIMIFKDNFLHDTSVETGKQGE